MKCKGCGAMLQYTNATEKGYSPKENVEYCQRCFRLTHYDDQMISYKTGIEASFVYSQIEKMDALIVWVVDLFDFEANIIENIHRHLKDKDILMVGTKRDLLPQTMSANKLQRFIFERLKSYDIQIRGLVVVGEYGKDGKEDVEHAIDVLRENRDVVFMGNANAGKSTLINQILGKNELTMSHYPGTTLDMVKVDMGDYVIYDSPGITKPRNALLLLNDKQLRNVIPSKAIKPTVFQLKDDQSFAIGGMARLDLIGCENVSIACYFAPNLKLHRSKHLQADKLWEKHKGGLFSPTINEEFEKITVYKYADKFDVVFYGLGWICVNGNPNDVVVYKPKELDVISRKAMI